MKTLFLTSETELRGDLSLCTDPATLRSVVSQVTIHCKGLIFYLLLHCQISQSAICYGHCSYPISICTSSFMWLTASGSQPYYRVE